MNRFRDLINGNDMNDQQAERERQAKLRLLVKRLRWAKLMFAFDIAALAGLLFLAWVWLAPSEWTAATEQQRHYVGGWLLGVGSAMWWNYISSWLNRKIDGV